MRLSILIPMYNERSTAETCVRALADAMERGASGGREEYEILFCDDGSTDGCAGIVEKTARELALTCGNIRVLRSERNRGKGHAVRLGMQASRGDFCVFTDCDLAYGTDVIRAMLSRMEAGENAPDVLIGSRAIADDGYAGYTVLRKAASKAYVRFLSLSTGFRYTDSQCGLKMFRGDAARKLFALAEEDGWTFDFEILLLAEKLRYTIAEYPVTVLNHRDSKIHVVRDGLKMLSDIRKIRRRIGSLTL